MTQFFLIIMGTFVFFMQTGFAFLEAGSVGGSCVINILFKVRTVPYVQEYNSGSRDGIYISPHILISSRINSLTYLLTTFALHFIQSHLPFCGWMRAILRLPGI